MPTYTQTGTVEGEPENYSVTVPEANSVRSESFSTTSPSGVSFLVENNGNVDSIVTYANQTVTGASIYSTGWSAKVGGTVFTSGDTLEPGQTLQIAVPVIADDPGVGETGEVVVSVDIDHTQA